MSLTPVTLTTLAAGDAERKFQQAYQVVHAAFHHPDRADDELKAAITLSFHFEWVNEHTVRAYVDHPGIKTPKTTSRVDTVALAEDGAGYVKVDTDIPEALALFPEVQAPAEPERMSASIVEVPLTLATFAGGQAEVLFQAAWHQLAAAFLAEDRGGAKGSIKLPLQFELVSERRVRCTVGKITVNPPATRRRMTLARMSPSGRAFVDVDELDDGARLLPIKSMRDRNTRMFGVSRLERMANADDADDAVH